MLFYSRFEHLQSISVISLFKQLKKIKNKKFGKIYFNIFYIFEYDTKPH